jgi:diguanylate cyclase (GGDEF)-like protein
MGFFNESVTIFADLINNAILLFGLGFIYAATNYNQSTKKKSYAVLFGMIIGMMTILIMMNSWKFSDTLIFDTRSVLLVVTGLFFGPITTGVAAIMAFIYRLSVGGDGVYAGLLTIVSTSTLGLLWHKIRNILPPMKPMFEYLILGLFAHILTIVGFLSIPWPTAFEIIKYTLVPYLTFYPMLTAFLAMIVRNQKDRVNAQLRIKDQQLLLQASIDATKAMEVFALDTSYCYLSYNEYHEYSMKKYYDVKIKIGDNFLEYILHPAMKLRIKECLDAALQGEYKTNVSMVETENEKYLEEQYSPIIDEQGRVMGVTVFSQDISERKKYEQSILYLSYRDPLTNLHNRRYYTAELHRLDKMQFYPLSIIIVDINGLKIMNDAFGHDAGDLLLCTIADELIQTFKNESHIARIGGGEFVILMPNTDKEHAEKYVQTAKKTIESKVIYGMSLSVSFGLSATEGESPIEISVKQAEDDMYAHKLFEISSHRHETIKTILKTLHEKNPREEKHSERVSKICVNIGQALKMRDEDIKMLKVISNLHDIGKIAIDDAILNKPGKLDDKEWEQIKRHPEIGYRILATSPEYADIAQDILSHHERYDGRGYPRGLKSDEIPLRARIISVADAYDAMVSERPYRKPLTHQDAIDEIVKNRGTQFDPLIADTFITLFANQKEVIA